MLVWASRLVPGLLDRYLARTNIEAQQSERPIEPGRPDNLWEPVSGDHGAHGIFDGKAHSRSVQAGLAKRRRAVTVGIATAAVGTAVGMVAHRR